jgi:hypothetical protein
MFVINRKGNKEPLRYDQITDRNIELASGLVDNKILPFGKLNVNTTYLSKLVIESLKDNMTTSEIDELSAETSFYMSTYEPEYDTLASRIKISNLHKTTPTNFLNAIEILRTGVNPHTEKFYDIINNDLYEFIKNNIEIIEETIDYTKDYLFNYFGIKTLERGYLQKLNGKTIERPQHLFMRVALSIHGPNNKTNFTSNR